MILGGQHFLKALYELRSSRLKNGERESDLPNSLSVASMELVKQGAPYGLRAWLAGRHQRMQSASEAATLSDFFNLCLDVAKDRQADCIRRGYNAPDRCVFVDSEVWTLLERSGLKGEDEEKKDEIAIPGISTDVAAEQKKKRVCPPPRPGTYRDPGSSPPPFCLQTIFQFADDASSEPVPQLRHVCKPDC